MYSATKLKTHFQSKIHATVISCASIIASSLECSVHPMSKTHWATARLWCQSPLLHFFAGQTDSPSNTDVCYLLSCSSCISLLGIYFPVFSCLNCAQDLPEPSQSSFLDAFTQTCVVSTVCWPLHFKFYPSKRYKVSIVEPVMCSFICARQWL